MAELRLPWWEEARRAATEARRRASAQPGAVLGGVRLMLRLEGVAVFGAATLMCLHRDAGWGLFALLFLAPDLSMLGYLAGPRAGAAAYNAAHSYVGPLLLIGIGLVGGWALLPTIGFVWCAHIGLDRALGMGLKYRGDFAETHLGRLGRADPW